MVEKPAVERGNPVIPDAPVPSQVRMSMVPTPPPPIPKLIVDGMGGDRGSAVETVSVDNSAVSIEERVEVDAHPKGTIVIKIFENSPYEVEFEGMITGSEVDMAWKAMMKEYRVWKHNLFKKDTEQKSGGE